MAVTRVVPKEMDDNTVQKTYEKAYQGVKWLRKRKANMRYIDALEYCLDGEPEQAIKMALRERNML